MGTLNIITVEEFYNVSFGLHDLNNSDILLWFLHPVTNKKESIFVQDKDAFLSAVKEHAEWNAYYGICLRPHQAIPNPHWRGKRADTTALVLVGVDIDIQDPIAHKSTNLPASEDDALTLVAAYGAAAGPSLIVKSGYGLQLLWLFEEPEWFSGEGDAVTDRQVVEWVIQHTWGWPRVPPTPSSGASIACVIWRASSAYQER